MLYICLYPTLPQKLLPTPLHLFTYSSRFFFYKFIYLFYFWLYWVFIATHGLSPVAASMGLLFVAVHGFFIAVASLVAEHRL